MPAGLPKVSTARIHPNIVTIHDVDHEEGAFFITMELLEGTPLNKIVESRGKLSGFDAARLGIQITAGLGYAHDQRIIHRDIKSANLFFTNDKVVKIMDFGLAKMVEEVRKASTMVGGTPFYMAPEQSAGTGVDHRADLYALGVTLFELVTGKVPFTEGVITFTTGHAGSRPREREPSVPKAMALLILSRWPGTRTTASRPRPRSPAGSRRSRSPPACARRRGVSGWSPSAPRPEARGLAGRRDHGGAELAGTPSSAGQDVLDIVGALGEILAPLAHRTEVLEQPLRQILLSSP